MIVTETRGPVHVVRLSRPEKRNAMTPQMLDELVEAITRPAEGARAILIHGEGAAFCAGFDLAMCKADANTGGGGGVMSALLKGLFACIGAMRSQALPVVVAAHGSAIAGGCAMLAGADLVVADRNCKLGYPVTRIGVSPAVNAAFVNAALGFGRARERLLDTALTTADRAPGLVHEVVETPAEVLTRGLAIAELLACKGPAAIAATKRLLAEIEELESPGAGSRGLDASLSLAGGDEERRLLSRLNL